jgi:hypothetical protein
MQPTLFQIGIVEQRLRKEVPSLRFEEVARRLTPYGKGHTQFRK